MIDLLSRTKKTLANWCLLSVSLFVFLFTLTGFAPKAQAFWCCCCLCAASCCDSGSTNSYIVDAMNNYRSDFLMDSFYKGSAEPTLLRFTDQLVQSFMSQAQSIGSFIDASNHLAAQRDLQILNAQTIKRYAPSGQLCQFGSLEVSLAATEAKAKANQLALSEIGLSRHMGEIFSIAAGGRGQDNANRLYWFATRFCDLADNDNGLKQLCNAATPPEDVQNNRDIDYTRSIDNRLTINNTDFTNTTLTKDEEDVIALGHYLYGHAQFEKRLSPSEMKESQGSQSAYQDVRSVIASRSMAQNSYNVIAAMKSGSEDGAGSAVTPVMQGFLKSLGLSSQQDALIGKYPSYYAQMGFLTKKLYQSPLFYANLMDNPVNVNRASTAMQGIEMMQGRDVYDSMTRSEMLLALLVQLEARKVERDIQNRVPSADVGSH